MTDQADTRAITEPGLYGGVTPEADPWRAHDLVEQHWDGETPFCGEQCAGCLVVATVELNKRNPLTVDPQELAGWREIIAVTSGEVTS